MYLLDTNVISELRKQSRANLGVKRFFRTVEIEEQPLFLSAITIGELRRGVEMIRRRGDLTQAARLERWLATILSEYAGNILDFGATEAEIWGRLRVPHHENALDKQIAATALCYDLTLVTRNIDDFADSGAKLLNPFES